MNILLLGIFIMSFLNFDFSVLLVGIFFFLKSLNFFFLNGYYVLFSILVMVLFFLVFWDLNSSYYLLFLKFSFWSSFLFFNCWNLVQFFIFFELTLLFVVIYVVFSGNSYYKISSAVFMFIFTVSFSFLFLVGINFMNYFMGTFSFCLMNYLVSSSFFMSFSLSMVLLVSFPVLFLHFWLPKAHVDSPSKGSMFLAGVMIKMGGFGMLVFLNHLVYKFWVLEFFIYWGFTSSFLICIFCFLNLDYKKVVAYSSISHMSMVLVGLGICSDLSLSSCNVIMISHGLVSSFMFWSMGLFYYKSESRNLVFSWGIYGICKLESLIMMLSFLLNIGVPPLLGFMGELFLFCSVMNSSLFYSLILISVFNFFGLYMSYLNTKFLFFYKSDVLDLEKFFFSSSYLCFIFVILNIFLFSLMLWLF